MSEELGKNSHEIIRLKLYNRTRFQSWLWNLKNHDFDLSHNSFSYILFAISKKEITFDIHQDHICMPKKKKPHSYIKNEESNRKLYCI